MHRLNFLSSFSLIHDGIFFYISFLAPKNFLFSFFPVDMKAFEAFSGISAVEMDMKEFILCALIYFSLFHLSTGVFNGLKQHFHDEI